MHICRVKFKVKKKLLHKSQNKLFQLLNVERREIIWLEMPFSGPIVQNLDTRHVETLMKKLNSKLTIGQLLKIKAEAQNLQLVDTPDADEVYTRKWAQHTAAVTKLLIH